MAPDKIEGPTHCLTFLGIELDTFLQEARLPAPKLAATKELVSDWLSKSSATLQEIQSLVGHLQFACKVVRPGRHYLRRLIDFGSAFQQDPKFTQRMKRGLSPAVQEDIKWWKQFLEQWNGISLLYERDWEEAPSIELFTDACNTGYGAYFQGEWFAGAWSPAVIAVSMGKVRLSMPFLELHALVSAAATWGNLWNRKKITFRCDCLPVVKAITKGSSRSAPVMHLIRHLASLACTHGFDYRCIHISGVENTIADILSRSGGDQEFQTECISKGLRPRATMTPPIPIPLPMIIAKGTPVKLNTSSQIQ